MLEYPHIHTNTPAEKNETKRTTAQLLMKLLTDGGLNIAFTESISITAAAAMLSAALFTNAKDSNPQHSAQIKLTSRMRLKAVLQRISTLEA